MITKIENNLITVSDFGLPAGVYPPFVLEIKTLVRERNLLQAKLFEQSEMVKEEVSQIENLISQLTEIIVSKCGEGKQ